MTRDEMQELKRLAEESPSADELDIIIGGGGAPGWMLSSAMSFIRAANPQTVLALIARIEELEGK